MMLNSSPKIALQLYTLRDQMNHDLQGTLQAVKSAGYDYVETAFWPDNISLQAAAKLLRQAGLAVCSAHCALPVAGKKSEMLDIAGAFQCTHMIWHGWPEDSRYGTMEGVAELTDIYNETNQLARANGLRFGLHNHWWEFRNRLDGRLVYEWMLDFLEEDIFFELDTYWIKVAGLDPAKIISDVGKRAPLLHVKDGPARWVYNDSTEHDPQVALGKGSQNFYEIVRAAFGNTAWMVVEMDLTSADVMEAIKESRDYLVPLLEKANIQFR